MSSTSPFDFGEVVESNNLLKALLAEDIRDYWIDYTALDNAIFFQLVKFTMHGQRFHAKFYGENDRWSNRVWIQIENGFAPCGWFRLK